MFYVFYICAVYLFHFLCVALVWWVIMKIYLLTYLLFNITDFVRNFLSDILYG